MKDSDSTIIDRKDNKSAGEKERSEPRASDKPAKDVSLFVSPQEWRERQIQLLISNGYDEAYVRKAAECEPNLFFLLTCQLDGEAGCSEPATLQDSAKVQVGPRKKNLPPKTVNLSEYLSGKGLKLADLTEKQREVASLKFERGLSMREIARRMGLHLKTVQEHLDCINEKWGIRSPRK